MRNARNLLFAGAAAAALLGAGAVAAETVKLHTMTVHAPGGGTVVVRYTGDTPPKVTFDDTPFLAGFAPGAFAGFAPGFDRTFADFARIQAEMDRNMQAMLQQANRIAATAPEAGGLYNAGFANLPKGAHAYSYFSSSSSNGVCTKSVEITNSGSGAPHVERHSAGDCGKDKNTAAPDASKGI